MGVKIRPYMEYMDREVLEYANDLAFPIIDIDEDVPLSDIMMPASEALFKKQASLLDRLETVQGELTSAVLNEKGTGEIVKIVHENIKNPTILSLDYMDKMDIEFGNISEMSKGNFLEDIEKYNSNNDKRMSRKVRHEKILHNGKFIKRLIVPVILRDNVYGHIFAWSTNSPLGGFDISILESAATNIALSVLQDLSIKEVEIKYKSEFFEDLISKDKKRRAKALERAHFLNLDLESHYVVEVISFKLCEEDNKEAVLEYLKEYANIIVMSIEDTMSYYGLDGIVSTKLNGIQILLSFKDEDEDIKSKIGKFNEKIMEDLYRRFPLIDMRIGVGRVYYGLEYINKSFSDSLKAIRTGKIVSDENIVTYDELGIFKLLSQECLEDELEDFYNVTLKTLVDYDQNKSTELVKTLSSYFEHNGNLTRMSEALYTHYNTILYRINRINDITGLSLENSRDRLNLEIALKIKELL